MSDNEADNNDAFQQDDLDETNLDEDKPEGEEELLEENGNNVVPIGAPTPTSGNGGRDRPTARPKHERTTSRFITKYEKARVLGTRALQISLGAPITVPHDNESDPLRIAQKELRARTLPIIIRRFLPDQTYEDWKISELIVD